MPTNRKGSSAANSKSRARAGADVGPVSKATGGSVCQLNDFDDLDGARNVSNYCSTTGESSSASSRFSSSSSSSSASDDGATTTAKKAHAAAQRKKNDGNYSMTKKESKARNKSSDDDGNDEGSSDGEPLGEVPKNGEFKIVDKEARRKRRADRARQQQHSDQPMNLSRRMSYKLSKHPQCSPLISPIQAVKIVFTPKTVDSTTKPKRKRSAANGKTAKGPSATNDGKKPSSAKTRKSRGDK